MDLSGILFRVVGDLLYAEGRALTDEERAYIRAHKAELMAETERRGRRDEVLMMLADNPNVRYAYTVDASTDPVIVAVAIREAATFELTIPADRYDPWKLLSWLDDSNGPEPA